MAQAILGSVITPIIDELNEDIDAQEDFLGSEKKVNDRIQTNDKDLKNALESFRGKGQFRRHILSTDQLQTTWPRSRTCKMGVLESWDKKMQTRLWQRTVNV
jgi:hypothetical protein